MIMDKEKRKTTGKSDARKRQGGDIVPVPPRSRDSESCDGLTASSSASEAVERTIAEFKDKKRIQEGAGRSVTPMEELSKGFIFEISSSETEEERTPCIIRKLEDYHPEIVKGVFTSLEEDKDKYRDNIARYFCGRVNEMLDKIRRGISTEELNIEEEVCTSLMNLLVGQLERRYQKKMKDCEAYKKGYAELKDQIADLQSSIEQEKRKVAVSKEGKDIGLQIQMEAPKKRKEIGLQIQMDPQVVVDSNPSGIERKLDEVIRRLDKLEEGRFLSTSRTEKEGEEQEKSTSSWSKVIGRKEKERRRRRDPSSSKGEESNQRERREPTRREKSAEDEKKRREVRPLQALRRKLPRGAGVLLEIQGGTSGKYEELIRKCQREISLEELEIPPVGIRKTRGGGILLEVRSKEKEEEKTESLAERIKEVVGSMEGAKVRCPLLRLRLKLIGVPIGATASEIAGAVAGVGRDRVDRVRLGPLRTSASGAGSAWVVCPKEMALRAAEAAELTLGWTRVGVALEKGGPPQCHRCLARGHLRRWCPSGVSRGACCLRCGREGHQIGRCGQEPHCPICEERGLQAEHRPGDPSKCRPVPSGVDRGGRSPRERPTEPPSPGPVEGPGGGVNGDRRASAPGGDLSPPGGEAPSSLDPGEGSSGVGRGPATGPGDATEGRPSGRLWGNDLSSGDEMEVEELRYNLKRKG